METSIGKIEVGKAKRRRGKGKSWEKERGKEEKEEIKEGKDNGGKKSSRRMGDIR